MVYSSLDIQGESSMQILIITDTGEIIRPRALATKLRDKGYTSTYCNWSTKAKLLLKKWDCIVIMVDSYKRTETLCTELRKETSIHCLTPIVCRGFNAIAQKNLSVAFTDASIATTLDSVLTTKHKTN